jgi:integrase
MNVERIGRNFPSSEPKKRDGDEYMPRKAKGLTAAMVKTAKPGKYGDGRNLFLYVKADGSRFWTFRYARGGRAHELGLGPASGTHPVTLSQARESAYGLIDLLRAGKDPAEQRAKKKAEIKAKAAIETAKPFTFADAATQFLDANGAKWKSKIHRDQFERSLRVYADPVIAGMAVKDIKISHVREIIEPIWHTKTETASRVRSRIENVLDYAAAVKEWSDFENPARWSKLSKLLPERQQIAPIVHHPALPWQEMPGAMAKLAAASGTSAMALRFIVLTAVRSGEGRKAVWGEFDLKARVWTIPPERMKAGELHRVPLSDAVVSILEAVKPAKVKPTDLVFPGGRAGKPLSDVSVNKALANVAIDVTVHGCRSSFRDWCGDATQFPREIAEQCLAHSTGNAVENAYKRTDFLEKRRAVMQAWGEYCTTQKVHQIEMAKAA